MDTLSYAFIAFFILLLIARLISHRSLKSLSQEQKGTLVDLVADGRLAFLAIIIGAGVIVFINTEYHLLPIRMTTIGYMVLLIGVGVFRSVGIYRKLKKHQFPESFIRHNLRSTLLIFVGLFLFFIWSLNIDVDPWCLFDYSSGLSSKSSGLTHPALSTVKLPSINRL